MGDIYSYPVYFEGGRLSQEQKRRITNYFRAKCNSDGECSPVEEVSENIYKIAFRHREVQQSVLQRREHIVQLGEESLTLTVNESLDPQTSGHTSTSASTSTSATHPVQVFTSAQEEIHQNQDQGQDQQAVLQRSEHIVQLREDSLMLTVKKKHAAERLQEQPLPEGRVTEDHRQANGGEKQPMLHQRHAASCGERNPERGGANQAVISRRPATRGDQKPGQKPRGKQISD
ncbi:uncharacterized protein LOC115408482 isoform X3 [Salarias fasciatus]|uniref:uncharacterized protein LOC115408482 isoform X3 n=1 Tax=Salarias fasciatus TaxID=181472 RepID=UPI0011767438|nr:uncharacterized protein LOC115408482 isoform X3 [Salarias fasciatus]